MLDGTAAVTMIFVLLLFVLQVLDEADKLLEMGFKDELMQIVKACPVERQTLFFSATMTQKVGMSRVCWRQGLPPACQRLTDIVTCGRCLVAPRCRLKTWHRIP